MCSSPQHVLNELLQVAAKFTRSITLATSVRKDSVPIASVKGRAVLLFVLASMSQRGQIYLTHRDEPKDAQRHE